MKQLPIGVSDFKELIEGNYYFIDKTNLLKEIVQDGAKVKLFTRPRRFGKTLNMSMLRYFFDIKNAENHRKLFTGLDIRESSYFEKQGKYPVIYLSLKDIKEVSWQDCSRRIRKVLSDLFAEYKYLRDDLDQRDLKNFDGIWLEEADGNYFDALKDLSKYLLRYHEKKVVILLDEYDTPMVSAYENGYYEEAMTFFRNFYSAALKDNVCLELGVMTGILRVAKEGIFSGLNNLAVYSILDERYSSYFGLTEMEVKEALNYYELKSNLQEVKEWYDGYCFGKIEIYNPWSIINYISNRKVGAYWVGTSNNFLVYDLLEKSGRDIFEDLRKIFQGSSLPKTLDYSFSFQDMQNPNEVWQLLTHSGYLKAEELGEKERYALSIPNREIYSFFEKSFLNRFLGGVDLFQEMIKELKKENLLGFERRLQSILSHSMSYYDGSMQEKYYHNLVLGMLLSLTKEYHVRSNQESGYGRYDLLLEPKRKEDTAYLFEFKVAKREEDLEKKAEEAIAQMEENHYDVELRERGIAKLLLLGIAFCGKKVKVKFLDKIKKV
ncbi:9-O-acetyl-N-acetylneuraminate esterase [Fusobacterium necrophorum subsp. funduliforme]|uniref:AAA family ATPase n=1 Tax=Fusobacterium necrophorum TaxID=859 RepID=UPI0007894F4B|nr:AAA family ATPase [Fusobacterium necrophorum]KYM38859.1 9-O-acetyl-N-acetylneuraminate esterase [Fusobacterium necrophorum subsp. funduliforme]KYM51333.1 9-O-acetyl-N-acetylneuraminate esterase [Fusobacterium necrophorum subsp. funduliforme]KYM62795.1 9-O-acetyl-N-acetylneuraminate esterase [Fusobacterium necrophorum subsp. funduliforme]MDK4477299.1 ATP-binding protein [Fusobacterium necrophorum]MDK4493439.1 ATP-binding protein [Fusobacterium necrophorum]